MTRETFDRLYDLLRSSLANIQDDYDSTDIDWDLVANDLENAATIARTEADADAERRTYPDMEGS